MKKTYLILTACMLVATGLSCQVANAQRSGKKSKEVLFKKHTITNDFIAEGAAAADVNKDGKRDIIAGAFWFEAPNWIKHEIDEPKQFDYKTGYSNAFLHHSMDINQDGWPDVIRIDFPGEAAFWYENAKNKPGHWKKHVLYTSVGNESPRFVDVDGDGRDDIICADTKQNRVVWLESPKTKGDTLWTPHVISDVPDRGTHQFTHGLGYGDVNKDGRKDILIRSGWWEAPADRKQANWVFHEADFGEECSQMFVMDLDDDGDQDVLSASAHAYGIWWHEQLQDANGKITWKTHEITKDFSQTHGVNMADINRDGNMDFVTGKRYYAHQGHDPGGNEPAVIYWYEFKPGKQPTWTRHLIDDNSGAGLQVVIQDMNKDKLVDVVIGNKKGVFYFEQIKK